MSREAILKVRETEEQANSAVLEAREAAQKMIACAEQDGRALCEATEAEMLEKREEMMARIREKADEIAVASLAEADEECKQLVRDVTLRRKMAEKIIIRGLDSKCR